MRARVTTFLLAFLLAGASWGATDKSMGHFYGTFRDASGDAVDAGTVTVYEAGTLIVATIYGSDDDTDLKGNPFLTDANGGYDFWAPPSIRYKLVVSKGGVGSFEFDELQVGVQPHAPRHATVSTDPIDPATISGTFPDAQKVNVEANGAGTVTENTIDFLDSDIEAAVADAGSKAAVTLTIATNAVTTTHIADGTVSSLDIQNDQILNEDINSAAGIAESKLALGFPTHDNANDPSAGEKAALVGTSGTPGAGNRYTTDADPRLSDPRSPTAHVVTHEDGGADALRPEDQETACPDGNGTIATAGSMGCADLATQAELDAVDGQLHAATHEDGGADEISIAGLVGEAGVAQKTAVEKGGVLVGTRPAINFIEGGNVTLTITDDPGNNEVDVSVTVNPAAIADDKIESPDTTAWVRTDQGGANDDVVRIGTSNIERVAVEADGDFTYKTDLLFGDYDLDRICINCTDPAQALDIFGNINLRGGGTVNGVSVEDHADLHEDGGGQEITVDLLVTSCGNGTGLLANLGLMNCTDLATQVELDDHDLRHEQGGADPVEAENLGTGCATGNTLLSNGTGIDCNTALTVDTGAPASAVVVDSSGKLGVGGAATDKLQVTGGAMRVEQTTGDPAVARFVNTQRSWQSGVDDTGSYFIDDETGTVTPFILAAGAPAFSLVADADGVGIGTSDPTDLLTISKISGTTSFIDLTGDTTDDLAVNFGFTHKPAGGNPQAFRFVPILDPSAAVTTAYSFNNNTKIGGSSSFGFTNLYGVNLSLLTQDAYNGTVTNFYPFITQGWGSNTSSGSPAVTNFRGFVVLDPAIDAASENTAFYSDMNAGSGKWGFNLVGTADNFTGGDIEARGIIAADNGSGTNARITPTGNANGTNGVTGVWALDWNGLSFTDDATGGASVGGQVPDFYWTSGNDDMHWRVIGDTKIDWQFLDQATNNYSNFQYDDGLFSFNNGIGIGLFHGVEIDGDLRIGGNADAPTSGGGQAIILEVSGGDVDPATDDAAIFAKSDGTTTEVLVADELGNVKPLMPKVFAAYDAAGGTAISNASFTDITWDTEIREDTTYFTHAADAAVLTFDDQAWYRVSAGCSADTSDTVTRQIVTWRFANSGGTAYPGTTRFSYHRIDTAGEGSVHIETLIDNTGGANSTVKLQAQAGIASTVTTIAQGCSINAERL